MRNYLSTGYGQGKSRIIRSYYIYNNPSIQLIGSLHTLPDVFFHYTTPCSQEGALPIFSFGSGSTLICFKLINEKLWLVENSIGNNFIKMIFN